MFFHISIKNLSDEDLTFIPRIPPESHRLNGENTTIPRICVSKTLRGCLFALSSKIHDLLLSQYINNKPIPIFIYGVSEKSIDKTQIICYEELLRKNYVEDACITREHWILEPVKLKPLGAIFLNESMYRHICDVDCDKCKLNNNTNKVSKNKCKDCPYPYVDSCGYLDWDYTTEFF